MGALILAIVALIISLIVSAGIQIRARSNEYEPRHAQAIGE